MENFLYNISQVLGITIIHSLWQGLLVYFVLRLALMFSGKLPASKKYVMAVTSLLAITLWFVYTLLNEIHIYNWLATAPAKLSAMPLVLDLPAGIHRLDDQSIRYYYSIEEYLPYISIVYVAGLVFNAVKLVLARKKINTIKQTMSIDIALQYQVTKFAGMLNIAANVKVGLSKLVDVPCMVGFLKPVILLPFTLSSYLSADEIEAILLHELAHIKRNDYLINLLQQVIAILLFFNPCTQLINRMINEERENSCDDMVVNTTANPMIYAKALLKLEQTRENSLQLAMSAIGKKYYLLNRIERIMKTKKQIPSLRPALLATLILTAGIGLITLLSPQIAQGKISVKAYDKVMADLLGDTTHKTNAKRTQHISQSHPVKRTVHAGERTRVNSEEINKKMEELQAEIQLHSEAVNNYYNSEAFKSLQTELEERGRKIQEFYDRPELKRLQEDLEKASKDFSKNYGGNDDTQRLSAQMGEMGRKIGAYYSTPEFKKMNEALEKKYGIPHNRRYNNGDDYKDENYLKYQAEVESHVPAEIKQITKQLETMGKEMSARYETPEFKERNRRMQELGDSLNKAYDTPEVKAQQKEMERLSMEMSNYQSNPQVKKEQEQLDAAVKKLTAFMKSSGYKKYFERLNDLNYNFNYNFNYNDDEKPEKVEKAEKVKKMEKAEKAEKVEKAEKIEKKEKPEKPEDQQ